mmetsp:Transcript_36855/g.42031  ORF Transcript_36855/g.42031 Transcript_36855/m.42031 type:complete len:133 (+) Transcript_36855:44-442(+)
MFLLESNPMISTSNDIFDPQHLYPSITSMPDIPTAEEVFSEFRNEKNETTLETFHRHQIEISPGHWVEVRGFAETYNSFQRNFFQRINCISCSIQIKFIQDAAFVRCPICQVIQPINDDMSGNGLALGVAGC